MKSTFQLVVLVILITSFSANAQNYKGLWHGYVTEHNNKVFSSRYFLQVKEHKGNIFSGRAFLYSKERFLFQGMFDFIGTINQTSSKVTELVIVKSIMPAEITHLCIKYLNLTYGNKGGKESLTGQWSGETSEKYPCFPGDVYLKRYTVADSAQSDTIPASILKVTETDTSPKMTFANTELTPPIVLEVRKNIVALEITDYLREDNDTVSVYLNRTSIISNLLINNKAYKKHIRLDKLSGLNEIIVYAENLGRIPPNTCVLTVDDGITKQKVNIFSSKKSSAVVYLNYTPDPKKQKKVKNLSGL